MPKGDRLKLKADPEDGTTPIANLLLEAVAMAKISGLQKGAILYLWRRTYGWVEGGERLKERKIPLSEWINALDSEKSRVSKTLGELEAMGIIKRRIADMWGGYYYSINTNVKSWNSNSINIAKLSEMITVGDFSIIGENATVGENDNSRQEHNATVGENDNPTVGENDNSLHYIKKILNKDKRKKVDKVLSTPNGLKVKEVFARIDKLRGYRPPKRAAEAGAILRMLKTYTPDQIIETWQKLKGDKFWQGKELYLMSVENQIGAETKQQPKQGKNSNMIRG